MRKHLVLYTTMLVGIGAAGSAIAQEYGNNPVGEAGQTSDIQTQNEAPENADVGDLGDDDIGNDGPTDDSLGASSDVTEDVPDEGRDQAVDENGTTTNTQVAGANSANADIVGRMTIMSGDEIYNQAGDSIGTVEGVVIDGQTRLIVSVGDFLGLGGRSILLDPAQLNARAEGGYSVAYTEAQLEQMPAFNEGVD